MFLSDKRILVTGACGTIGRELVRQLLEETRLTELVAVDNNESELYFLELKYARHSHASFSLADIRDRDTLSRMMKGMDVVFHTAAFKHIVLCERSPFEAVQTNIIGVQNIIHAAIENKVGHVVFTSSDKAVNPTNVMGTSKLMGERLITAANSTMRTYETVFVSVRFGNVLGSRGSVIPIFCEQIRQGGPVTVTHPEMTRFIMSIHEAVRLVVESVSLARGGEVFVTKMPVIRIQDLAEVMIRELSPLYGYRPEEIATAIVGARPGEKLYEELINHEETRRSWELDRYFVVLPAFGDVYRDIVYDYPEVKSKEVVTAYHSGNVAPLSQSQLAEFLRKNSILLDTGGER